MTTAEGAIRAIAWDTHDAALLVSIFHPDVVWAWPPSPDTRMGDGEWKRIAHSGVLRYVRS